MDISIFGDTEIQYKGLSTSIENLKKEGNNSKGQCKLEIEYEVRGLLELILGHYVKFLKILTENQANR